MGKASETLKKNLAKIMAPHGAISELIRKSGFSRTGLEKWRDGISSPSIENLDRLSEALETDPVDLISDNTKSNLSTTQRKLISIISRTHDQADLESILIVAQGLLNKAEALDRVLATIKSAKDLGESKKSRKA